MIDFELKLKKDVTYEIINYVGRSREVNIPQLINNKEVTSIGERAFFECSSLTNITIPESVNRIGDDAFIGCSNLTSIMIPNSVTSIGRSAFSYCSSLESIVVGKNNPKYDSRNNCNAIIETSSNMLIVGCKNTIIPNSVTNIGDYVFPGCSSLESVTIPDNVTSIGRSAFSGCSSLESIVVGKNNPKYDSRNNCNAIIETSSNTLVLGCKNTIIPSSVTSIGEYAFECCSCLESITIPDSVTSIGDMAFIECSNLTSITIPDGVISIEEEAFYYCYNLTSINFQGTKAQWESITKGSDWNSYTGSYIIHCTDGDIAKS